MAFPTTGILDDFNRVENPLSTGWTGPLWTGNNRLEADGTSASSAAPGWGNSYRTSSVGPDCEVGVTMFSSFDQVLVYARLVDAGISSTMDGYVARLYTPSNRLRTVRMDNGGFTNLDDIAFTWATGDAIGMSCIGSTIKGYINDGGAGWVEKTSAVDSTYAGAGPLGIEVRTNDGPRVDNFFGGTVVSGKSMGGLAWSGGLAGLGGIAGFGGGIAG